MAFALEEKNMGADADEVFVVPEETEMLEFFGSDPVEKDQANGFWSYEFTDKLGVSLGFSLNRFERSVQTVLVLDGKKVVSVSHEGAVRLWIESAVLVCTFKYIGAEARLVVSLQDGIRLDWASLRTQ
jgi:hypothetical protein